MSLEEKIVPFGLLQCLICYGCLPAAVCWQIAEDCSGSYWAENVV